jgi:hypothetical protein
VVSSYITQERILENASITAKQIHTLLQLSWWGNGYAMTRLSRRKYFLCTGEAVDADYLCKHPHSHIIGHLQKVMDDERRVTALARWDVSIGTCADLPDKPAVDVYLIGDARGIKCRYPGCKNEERWEIGQGAFMSLMARYGKVPA